jgi:pyridoxal phosphate enzyme (YggS family)
VTEGSLAERLATVQGAIADAAREAGRDASDITTIVVTKFHPAERVRELSALGVRDVGENRHQEASAKAAEVSDLDLVWHFVGQLQSKKARQAKTYARVFHSLDRESVIDALSSPDGAVDGFVQLNLTDDPGRGGVQPGDLQRVAEHVIATEGIRLLGVMAVAPIDEEPRRAFERVRRASEALTAVDPGARYISAGMSGDFRDAILEGATHLRIGSAITGNRQTPG